MSLTLLIMQNSHSSPSNFSILSAMFLVAGTCIGGGMLALPIATGISGFLPSLIMMSVCWLAMTSTALLLLEISLWMPEGAHISSMTATFLGRFGQLVSWILYLFICYASIVAYTAGGGVQIAIGLREVFGITLGPNLSSLAFIIAFGSIVYFGSEVVGRVNTVLFIGMLAAYVGLMGMGVSEVNPDLLKTSNWRHSIGAIPLLLTSFSFQTMVPSLTPYLKRNRFALRAAVVGGTLITFFIYLLWQILMLGIVPVEGPSGLAEALAKGEPSTQFLREHVQGVWIYPIAESFAFFAIATSFLGVALGLYDFLADGLHIPKRGLGKVVLGLLIVVPCWIFATRFERVFLTALESSGGIGDAVLNGMIPLAMFYIGKYTMGHGSNYRLFGGKLSLLTLFFFYFITLMIQLFVWR